MSMLEDLKRSFGEDVLALPPSTVARQNWHEVCVCGHLDRYHSPSIGGTYTVPEVEHTTVLGREFTRTHAFHGCAGALKKRNFIESTMATDRDAGTQHVQIHPTCPCEEFRPVAKVDRPNRYFNQQVPNARGDLIRHPFITGVRAFSTHLSRRKAATVDPTWAEAEFDRRFTWLSGARVCGISKCKATDDVWPVFVDGDRSELRCPRHR